MELQHFVENAEMRRVREAKSLKSARFSTKRADWLPVGL
jgi:hypothetical protein